MMILNIRMSSFAIVFLVSAAISLGMYHLISFINPELRLLYHTVFVFSISFLACGLENRIIGRKLLALASGIVIGSLNGAICITISLLIQGNLFDSYETGFGVVVYTSAFMGFFSGAWLVGGLGFLALSFRKVKSGQ